MVSYQDKMKVYAYSKKQKKSYGCSEERPFARRPPRCVTVAMSTPFTVVYPLLNAVVCDRLWSKAGE